MSVENFSTERKGRKLEKREKTRSVEREESKKKRDKAAIKRLG
jgi:hypothetical protein